MKYMVLTIGLMASAMGAACMVSDLQPAWASAVTSNTEYFWLRSSGPHGERNPAALPLYEAIIARDKDKVAALLGRGASPNLLLYPGRWSPLMLAIAYNDHKIVRLLVKHGANVNYISNDPATGTPLAAALISDRLHTIEHPDFSTFYYLLDSGADMNVEFHDMDIAIYAVTLGQMGIVNNLLARGYRHDLQKLKKNLKIIRVDKKMQPEKDRAIATVDRLLAEGK